MPFINHKDRVYKKPYKLPYMTAIARDLRKNQTAAEKVLWEALRKHGFFGLHFRRQAPFGRYVFDSYCAKKRFGVEIDGSSHIGKERYDQYRDEYVKGFKVRVLRVLNDEVLTDADAVVERIQQEIFRVTERATIERP
jgi:very-short-patch-repair endonuclease